MAIKCYHPNCSKCSPPYTVYRINEKGKPGVFACEEHRNKDDPDFIDLVKLLEQSNDPDSSKPQHS